jgi:hypothetical protein
MQLGLNKNLPAVLAYLAGEDEPDASRIEDRGSRT